MAEPTLRVMIVAILISADECISLRNKKRTFYERTDWTSESRQTSSPPDRRLEEEDSFCFSLSLLELLDELLELPVPAEPVDNLCLWPLPFEAAGSSHRLKVVGGGSRYAALLVFEEMEAVLTIVCLICRCHMPI